MATKIKNELKEEYQGIKYILTSTMRTKLLLSIYNESKNLDDLRIELEKPSATILHGLKELENLNFVKKVQKYYHSSYIILKKKKKKYTYFTFLYVYL